MDLLFWPRKNVAQQYCSALIFDNTQSFLMLGSAVTEFKEFPLKGKSVYIGELMAADAHLTASINQLSEVGCHFRTSFPVSQISVASVSSTLTASVTH